MMSLNHVRILTCAFLFLSLTTTLPLIAEVAEYSSSAGEWVVVPCPPNVDCCAQATTWVFLANGERTGHKWERSPFSYDSQAKAQDAMDKARSSDESLSRSYSFWTINEYKGPYCLRPAGSEPQMTDQEQGVSDRISNPPDRHATDVDLARVEAQRRANDAARIADQLQRQLLENQRFQTMYSELVDQLARDNHVDTSQIERNIQEILRRAGGDVDPVNLIEAMHRQVAGKFEEMNTLLDELEDDSASPSSPWVVYRDENGNVLYEGVPIEDIDLDDETTDYEGDHAPPLAAGDGPHASSPTNRAWTPYQLVANCHNVQLYIRWSTKPVNQFISFKIVNHTSERIVGGFSVSGVRDDQSRFGTYDEMFGGVANVRNPNWIEAGDQREGWQTSTGSDSPHPQTGHRAVVAVVEVSKIWVLRESTLGEIRENAQPGTYYTAIEEADTCAGPFRVRSRAAPANN